MTNKVLLAVLAHPDDESYGPGGTLGMYAARGVDVHIAIATDGAAGSVAAGYEAAREELAAVREKELDRAVGVLGGTLHRLGYRDSGMQGDAANHHPEAFVRARESEAVGRVVALIRELKPQVVMTHDETGGYFHPDHIMCWRVVTAAFFAAGDGGAYSDVGEPHQAQRLYYTAVPERWIRFAVWVQRLRGKDPTKMGRNKDIDLTKLGIPNRKIHAAVDVRSAWEVKRRASAEHASQGGGTSSSRLLPNWLMRWVMGRELFIRAHPPVADGFREYDLFA